MQQAIVAVASAEADLAAANANLTQAEIALDDTVVRAPFDAKVTEESAAVGALVQAGASVGQLVASASVEILMGLTPGDLAVLGDPSVALGGTVVVRATDDPESVLGEGTVTQVDPRVDERTRTVSLVVTVSDPFFGEGRALRIDELVALELPVSLQNRIAVNIPTEALKGRDLVWRVEDGVLRRTSVQPVDRLQDRVVLRGASLRPGDIVMVSNLVAAFDGKEVRLERDAADGGESSD